MPIYLIVELNPFAAPQFDIMRQLQSCQCVRGQVASPGFASPGAELPSHFGFPGFAQAAPGPGGAPVQTQRVDEIERQLGRLIEMLRGVDQGVARELVQVRQHLGAHDGRLAQHDVQFRNGPTTDSVSAVSKSLAGLSGVVDQIAKDVAIIKGPTPAPKSPHKNGQVNGHTPGSGPLDLEHH